MTIYNEEEIPALWQGEGWYSARGITEQDLPICPERPYAFWFEFEGDFIEDALSSMVPYADIEYLGNYCLPDDPYCTLLDDNCGIVVYDLWGDVMEFARSYCFGGTWWGSTRFVSYERLVKFITNRLENGCTYKDISDGLKAINNDIEKYFYHLE